MALNLNHFNVAEDPDLFYRRVGSPAIDDFLNRGQIAGTAKYGTEAYFLRGAEWATSGAPNRITVDMSRLNPASNPLYGDVGLNRYLTQEGAFPIGKSAMASGKYPRLTPNANPSFWDTINPFNRRGIRIDNPITGKTVYDRLLPVTETPVSTTMKNLGVEARIAANASAPYIKGAVNNAGTFMNYAGVIPLATSELERKRSDYQNPVTQEYFTKDKVVELDGLTYESATPQQIAMFHPDNADEHPEITDEMRKKFYPKWFK